MRLFHGLVLVVIIVTFGVATYDLFQAELTDPPQIPRIIYDTGTRSLSVAKPMGRVRIVYASMFGPGEPVMRVRGKWMDQFEQVYGERLSEEAAKKLSAAEKATFAKEVRPRLARVAKEALERIATFEASGDVGAEAVGSLVAELRALGLVLRSADGPDESPTARLRMLRKVAETAASLSDKSDIDVTGWVDVRVERRWQGRWVLSANRPRFLSGNEVPDIITGGKMELLALVQDGYAVALDAPLDGGTSPLDGPDTYGDPMRPWREAYLPAMLKEARYSFLEDPEQAERVYLSPQICHSNGLFYNKVLFRKVGVDRPPRTWPEFLDVCEKLKQAGIPAITADQVTYCENWMNQLIVRAVGLDVYNGTMLGKPDNKPMKERVPDPPWTDDRYKKVFAQIRALHDRGYFDKDFAAQAWPASQRAFAQGKAAMMTCGTWLPQEIAGYKDIENQGLFELGCFTFPQWPGGPEEMQTAVHAAVSGLMVCRQGKATRHAIELVKFLQANEYKDLVTKNGLICCAKDAAFPEALAGIEEDFRKAKLMYSHGPELFARRFNTSRLKPRYNEFFLGELTVDEFLLRMEEANRAYLSAGGEESFE